MILSSLVESLIVVLVALLSLATMPAESKIIVVTGANKGIGLAIGKILVHELCCLCVFTHQ